MGSLANLNSYSTSVANSTITANVWVEEGTEFVCPVLTWDAVAGFGKINAPGANIVHYLGNVANAVAASGLGNITVTVGNAARPTITVSQSGNTWTIGNIRGVEDYLAAQTTVDLPIDYAGNITYQTVITTPANVSIPQTINVNLYIEDNPEWTNPNLADIIYNPNSTPLVLNQYQTTGIADEEFPDTQTYRVTISGPDHPARVIVDTTSNANLTVNTFGYANTNSTGYKLTLEGTKANINQHLETGNITFTVNTDSITTPAARTIRPWVVSRLVSGGTYPTPQPLWSNAVTTGNVVTIVEPGKGNVTTTTYGTIFVTTGDGPFGNNTQFLYRDAGNTSDGSSTFNTPMLLSQGQNNTGDVTILTADSTWTATSVGTHEFWVNFRNLNDVCVFTGPLATNIALFKGRIIAWSAAVSAFLPGQGGRADTVANRPRRIQHNTAITANTWYHVALTWDGTFWKLYVNGVDSSTYYTTGNTTTTAARVSTGWPGDWNIPGLSGGVNTYWHYGPVDSIGSGPVQVPSMSGGMAEIRVSTNVRYTSNFTPAAYPFYSDATTYFLYHGWTYESDPAVPAKLPGTQIQSWGVQKTSGNTTIGVLNTIPQNYSPQSLEYYQLGNMTGWNNQTVTNATFREFFHVNDVLAGGTLGVPKVTLIASTLTGNVTLDAVDVSGAGNSYAQFSAGDAGNTYYVNMSRVNTKDAQFNLPTVGQFANTASNWRPQPYTDISFNTVAQNNAGNVLISLDPSENQEWEYDSMVANSASFIRYVEGAFDNNGGFWYGTVDYSDWLCQGIHSHYVNYAEMKIQFESVLFYNGTQGWTRSGGVFGGSLPSQWNAQIWQWWDQPLRSNVGTIDRRYLGATGTNLANPYYFDGIQPSEPGGGVRQGNYCVPNDTIGYPFYYGYTSTYTTAVNNSGAAVPTVRAAKSAKPRFFRMYTRPNNTGYPIIANISMQLNSVTSNAVPQQNAAWTTSPVVYITLTLT